MRPTRVMAPTVEDIAIIDPQPNKCRTCRHSIPIAQGLGARVTCLLFSEQHPSHDHCCRWQTKD